MNRIDWKRMNTAPRDRTPVLLFIKGYGMVEGWYEPLPDDFDPDYDEGAVWVVLDDTTQFEVEEYHEPGCSIVYLDGSVIAWSELPGAPTWEE